MEYLQELYKLPVVQKLVSTLVLILASEVCRSLASRAIRRIDNLATEMRRRWLVQLRNASVIIILLGLILIWAEELEMMAVSLFAIAVACVIATKELIQCVTGSLLRTSARPFHIGDRIQVKSFRGDVIDQNLLTTTILEIGPDELTHQYTGRTVVLPNSLFLDQPLINESFTEGYVLHVFTVPIKSSDNWQEMEQDLLAAAREECSAFLETARQHFNRLGKREGLATLSVEPRVTYTLPKAGEIELVVRFPAPTRRKGRIEQAILRRFLLAGVERARKAAEASAAAAATTDVAAANAPAENEPVPGDSAAIASHSEGPSPDVAIETPESKPSPSVPAPKLERPVGPDFTLGPAHGRIEPA